MDTIDWANLDDNAIVMKIIEQLYKTSIKCLDVDQNKWATLVEPISDNKWIICDENFLKEKIIYDVTKQFFAYNFYYISLVVDKKLGNCATAKKISNICEKLKTTKFVESLIKTCTILFFDSEFKEKIIG